MSQTLPTQHPAVVLRSHYQHLRALLAIAMVAVIGLSGAVVILALQDEDTGGGTTSQNAFDRSQPGSVRSDGGPDETAVADGISGPPTVAKPEPSKAAWVIAIRHRAPAPPASQTSETTRPDESGVASAISGGTPSTDTQSGQGTRPDESGVASAISGD